MLYHLSFCAMQVSAFSSPFGQHHYADDSSEQGQGQDLLQPLLRSPSQLSSAAPSTSDAKLNAIPEHEQTNEDADTGLSARQESKQQVCFSLLTLSAHQLYWPDYGANTQLHMLEMQDTGTFPLSCVCVCE